MSGVKMGDEYVSAEEAKEGIIKFIRDTVGPRINPATGKSMKPDLLFAISVIKRTIPVDVLKGPKRGEFERAIDTLFDIRDRLCQIETTIGMYWRDEE